MLSSFIVKLRFKFKFNLWTFFVCVLGKKEEEKNANSSSLL